MQVVCHVQDIPWEVWPGIKMLIKLAHGHFCSHLPCEVWMAISL